MLERARTASATVSESVSAVGVPDGTPRERGAVSGTPRATARLSRPPRTAATGSAKRLSRMFLSRSPEGTRQPESVPQNSYGTLTSKELMRIRRRDVVMGLALGLWQRGPLRRSRRSPAIRSQSPGRQGRSTIDGDLSDDGWRGAHARRQSGTKPTPATTSSRRSSNVGYLTYDDQFFYAGFEFEDPDPGRSARRSPTTTTSATATTDYGGSSSTRATTATPRRCSSRNAARHPVRRDHRRRVRRGLVARLLLGLGERGSPTRGWTLEMRIPFSSLRYRNADPQTWGILLYRNYPRDRRYQFFSARLPRGGNCFICRSNTLVGLEHLPAGGHLVVAPFRERQRRRASRDGGARHRRSVGRPSKPHVGLDVKWTRRTPTTRSTSPSSPTSRRSNPTPRRSRRTNGSRCSFPRSVRSSSKASICFRRRSRRSTRARSRRRAGADAPPASSAASATPCWWPTMPAAAA